MDRNAFFEALGEMVTRGERGAAARAIEVAGSTDPVLAALGRALMAVADGNLDEAASQVALASAREPEDPIVLQYLGLIAQSDEEFEEAERLFRMAVARDSTVRSSILCARFLAERGRLSESEEILAAAFDMAPGNPLLAIERGQIARQKGDFLRALALFSDAFELAPQDDGALAHARAILEEGGKALGAFMLATAIGRAGLGESVTLAADLVAATVGHDVLASVFAQAELAAECSEAGQQVAQTARSRSAPVRVGAARRLIELGHVEAAHALLEGVTETDLDAHTGAFLWYLRGLLAEQRRDWSAATEAYATATRLDPSRWEAAANDVRIRLAQGTDEALEGIEGVFGAVSPAVRARSLPLRFNEALYSLRRGAVDAARAQFLRILEDTGGEGALAGAAREHLRSL